MSHECCKSEHAPESSDSGRAPLFYGFIFLVLIIGFGWWIYQIGAQQLGSGSAAGSAAGSDQLISEVVPASGVKLPIRWGDIGAQLLANGALDEQAFRDLYVSRGGLDMEMEAMLAVSGPREIVINEQNAPILLNLLWAVGLANENPILTAGPMQQYGDTGNFASTGGWTLARGEAMDHYAKHQMMMLTPSQQLMVENMAKGIYRPCCDNPTHLPDCNHGMAMLGLLEMMASQGLSEAQMYKVALAVNAYWFPDTYATIAKYFSKQGTSWSRVEAKQALGKEFSSGSGYARVLQAVTPVQSSGGGGCGV